MATIHLVHEVAHQWFYGLVGNDQFRDPWLDEGFAMYGQSRVDGQLAYQRSRTLPAYGRGHLGESMAYWGRTDGSTYYVSVYVGGVQALGKLADRLGGYGPLDCAIRRYVRDRAYTVSRPADVLASFNAQTGVDPAPILGPSASAERTVRSFSFSVALCRLERHRAENPADPEMLDVGLMFTTVKQGGARVSLGLLFLLLSGVFSFGWVVGSALGYQNGRRDAEELARLQAALVQSIELDLRQKTPAPAPAVVVQGSLLETV